MQVKVDQGFLNNIIELFSSGEESSREQEVCSSAFWPQKCPRYFCKLFQILSNIRDASKSRTKLL